MPKNKVITNFILALLIYLPTCAYIPLNLYLVLIVFTIILNKDFLKSYFTNLFNKKIIDKPFTFLLMFSIIAFGFRLSDFSNWESIKDVYSFAYLFPFTYIISRTLRGNKNIFIYFIYFIIIEAIVCFIEYSLGISTIFVSLNTYYEFFDTNLFYDTRVSGLSIASSGLSLKFLIGLMLINAFVKNVYLKVTFEAILLTASILVFGRMALIAIVCFYVLKLIHNVLVLKRINFVNLISIIMFAILITVNFTWVKGQFTRNDRVIVTTGRISIVDDVLSEEHNASNLNYTEQIGVSGVEMSGRNEIWNNYIDFGLKNLFTGNKGKKYMIGTYHAHNSYLEIFSSFGVLLSLGLMAIFAFRLNKFNYMYLLIFGLVAIGQYMIFWGVSFYDIVFYYLVFFYGRKNEKEEYFIGD